MKQYVFRNSTVEHLFNSKETHYSAYGDISIPQNVYERFIWFYLPKLNPDLEALNNELEESFEKFNFVFQQIQKECIVILPSLYYVNRWENNNRKLDKTLFSLIEKFEQFSRDHKLVSLVNIQDFFRNFSIRDVVDSRFYYTSDIIINPKLSKEFNNWLSLKLNAIYSKRKKCLILDLDNTLWGGIIGEDGYNKVALGDSYPGIAYKEFQKCILEASKNGVILALCSKNNMEDVEEIFSKNHEMILKLEHFSSIKANWGAKSDNIRLISEELNIGLDSMVFIDDNPMEREQVNSFLPEVLVPDFVQYPYQLVDYFWAIYNKYFQVHILTDEDKSKTEQYQSNTVRKLEATKYSSFEEYIQSLNIEIEVFDCNEGNIDRIAQMTQKTNQFNLTTKRYTIQELQNQLDNNAVIKCFRVKDKFGDNGITVLAIITLNDSDAYLDTFLLSCRILGRKIEFAIIKYLYNLMLRKKIKNLSASFIQTDKNKVASNFLSDAKFEFNKEDGIRKQYIMQINEPKEIEVYYKFTEIK